MWKSAGVNYKVSISICSYTCQNAPLPSTETIIQWSFLYRRAKVYSVIFFAANSGLWRGIDPAEGVERSKFSPGRTAVGRRPAALDVVHVPHWVPVEQQAFWCQQYLVVASWPWLQMSSGRGLEQLVVACRLKLGPTQLTTWFLHFGSPNDYFTVLSHFRRKISRVCQHVGFPNFWPSWFRHNWDQVKNTEAKNCITPKCSKRQYTLSLLAR